MAAALGDGEAGGLGEGWDGVGGRLGRAWGRGGGGGGAARGPHPHVDLGAGHPGAQPQEGHAPRHLAGTVELAESVAEGAGAAVPVPLWADVPGAVPEGERDAVALLESDTLGLGQWQREASKRHWEDARGAPTTDTATAAAAAATSTAAAGESLRGRGGRGRWLRRLLQHGAAPT